MKNIATQRTTPTTATMITFPIFEKIPPSCSVVVVVVTLVTEVVVVVGGWLVEEVV